MNKKIFISVKKEKEKYSKNRMIDIETFRFAVITIKQIDTSKLETRKRDKEEEEEQEKEEEEEKEKEKEKKKERMGGNDVNYWRVRKTAVSSQNLAEIIWENIKKELKEITLC